ncbi:MAG TPA: hypothetical protein VIE65_12455 [Methylobacter sp.]|jgi:hypothetical protein
MPEMSQEETSSDLILETREKGEKHCWELVDSKAATPSSYFARNFRYKNGQLPSKRLYRCKKCGAQLWSDAIGKIPGKDWKEAGIKECRLQAIASVMDE